MKKKLFFKTIAIQALILASTTGCGKEKNMESTSNSSVAEASKEIEENEESTVAAESDTSESGSSNEDTESETNLVEEIDVNKYIAMSDWIVDADYDEPKITIWDDQNAYMLSDGAVLEGDGAIALYVPGGSNNVKELTANVYIEEMEGFYFIQTQYLYLNQENVITCDITYNDGTQDTITVYFTWREE